MKNLFIIIAIILLSSCNTVKNNILDIPTINLPLKKSDIKAYENSNYNFEYEIICLEFNGLESVVNQSILSKIIIHDGKFIIGEKCNNIPKIFDDEGKFIATFLRGRAKNEIFSFRDFSVNYKNNTIDIMDGLNCIKRYDMDGNYLETFDCGIDALEIASFNDKIILYDANIRSKDKFWLQFYDVKKKQSEGFIEKFGMTKDIVSLPYSMSSYRDKVFLYPYSNDIIYIIEGENSYPRPFIKVDNVFSDREKNDLSLNEFIEICENKYYHGIFNFHICSNAYIYTRAGGRIENQVITDIETNESFLHPLSMIANGYDDEYEYFLLDMDLYEDIKDRFSIMTSELKNDIEKLISSPLKSTNNT